jgi:hypothetical protein
LRLVAWPEFVKGEALTPDSNPGPLAHQRRALLLGYSHQRREKVWNHTPSARAQGYKWDGTEESQQNLAWCSMNSFTVEEESDTS